MNNNLHREIHNNMNLKETDELIEIWQTNDRVEWSDTTFEIIKEILKGRGVEIPEQDEPIYEHEKELTDLENNGFTDKERKIIYDENPPEFYDPFEALRIGKWLDLAAKAMVILTILGTLLAFQRTKSIASAYFPDNPNTFFVFVVTIVIMVFNIVIVVPIYYLPLRALSQVLRILMEMEFNSRKVS